MCVCVCVCVCCCVGDSPVKLTTKLTTGLLQVYHRFSAGLLQAFYTKLTGLLQTFGLNINRGGFKNNFTDNLQINNVPE